MPIWKKKKDSVVARFFHRPISFYFSSFFCRLGLTSNQVSFVSLIIAFLSCVFFLISGEFFYIVGGVLMNLWSIIDSADGNMARLIGGKPYGSFIDATSSYVLVGFGITCIGFSVFRTGGVIVHSGNVYILLLAAFASGFDTMTRLFFQKMKNDSLNLKLNGKEGMNVSNNDGEAASKLDLIQSKIQSEFGLGGWNMIFIFVCILTHSLDLYVLFYFFYYGAFFVLATYYLIIKTKCLKK
jgi:phosphatidylglycerophosphate synthase